MKLKLMMYVTTLAFIGLSCNSSNEENENESATTPAADTVETIDPEEMSDQQSPFLYGIDISSFQGDEMETLDKNEDSLTFVICRATDGITFVDSDFQQNWQLIHNKGFTAGAYHFYESDDDPAAQVDNYLKTVGELSINDLPAIVDFEGGGIETSMSVEAVQDNLSQVLEILEEKTGRLPILYTNMNDGNKYLNKESFAKYTLWIADYSGGTEPTLPGAWTGSEWVLWQRSDDHVIDNVKNDFDVFNGGEEDFKALLNQ